MIAAVVLAAGLSRRMGADKLHLPVAGVPMFQHIIDQTARLSFDQRIVVTNDDQIGQYARTCGFMVIPSPHASKGMGYSVAAGAIAVRPEAQGICFFNADQPFLSSVEIDALCKRFSQTGGIVVPRVQGRPYSPCIFERKFLAELCTLSGDQGGKQVYRNHLEQVNWLDFADDKPFIDLDCPQAYAYWVQSHD